MLDRLKLNSKYIKDVKGNIYTDISNVGIIKK